MNLEVRAAFGRDDFQHLADHGPTSEDGRFIVSINATQGVRAIFGRFDCEDVQTTWIIAIATSGAGTRATELIVRGGGRN